MGSATQTSPIYEVIRREDIMAAFRDALRESNVEIIAQLEEISVLFSALSPASLWLWGRSSRWGFDMWR